MMPTAACLPRVVLIAYCGAAAVAGLRIGDDKKDAGWFDASEIDDSVAAVLSHDPDAVERVANMQLPTKHQNKGLVTLDEIGDKIVEATDDALAQVQSSSGGMRGLASPYGMDALGIIQSLHPDMGAPSSNAGIPAALASAIDRLSAQAQTVSALNSIGVAR
eukprot:TRINITY_DN122522_c0_g1_i1.p2 TRINITY_DN122522_c0_g1~~TRINITY_DN122522_c0_g1_i1.p2  ORF type:complete len:162 (+),score=38.31 TRINITY_DN122522_c0_g1_i1:82-567(+)